MKSDTLPKKSMLTTQKLVTVSLLTALSIVLARVFGLLVPIAGFPALKINFSNIPLIFTGIVYGPAAGFMAGAVSDVIGYMINPQGGAFFPGFTLSTALAGAVPGIIYNYVMKREYSKKINFNFVNAFFIIIITSGLYYAFSAKGVIELSGGFIYNGEKMPAGVIVLILAVLAAYITLPFYLSKSIKADNSLYSFDKLYFTVSITQIVTSLLLNTYFISVLFSKGFMVFIPARIVTNYIMIPLFTIITLFILKTLKIEKN